MATVCDPRILPAMRVALLVLAAALLAAADTVTLLDGSVREGTLAWAESAVTVDGGSIPLADVDTVVLAGTPASTGGETLVLADGSVLPYQSLSAGGEDLVAVIGPSGAILLPLGAIRSWGQAATAAVGDQDQLTVASGTYAGRVRGIRDGRLAFRSETLGDLDLDLADVQGLRLAGARKAVQGLHLVAEAPAGGPGLALLPGTQPRLAAAPAVALDAWPVGLRLRVEGGRRVLLSTLTPFHVEEAGVFGRTWTWRRDTNLEGGPILLDGRRYARGLSLHSRSVLRWKLADGFERFTARIGIADEVGGEGDCPVFIRGDGKVLWSRERLRGSDASEVVNLDLRGIDILELNVEVGERYDIGDRVTFADAALIRRSR